MKKGFKLLLEFLKKLTVFDWLIILVVFSSLVFLMIVLFKKEKWVRTEVKTFKPYWQIGKIKPGDAQYDFLGRKIAEVLEVRTFEEEAGEVKRAFLVLKVKVGVDKNKKIFKFDNELFGVGRGIELQLENIIIDGVVTYIEGVPDTRLWEDKIVETGLFSVPYWIPDSIKVGDQMRDNWGVAVGEILEKKVSPAQRVVTTDDGRLLVRYDPVLADVIMTIKLKTVKEGEINYFLTDARVQVDWELHLHLPNIDIYPVIIKVLE